MTEHWQSGEDRRRYFRVEDELLIGYQVLIDTVSERSTQLTQDISVLSQLERQVSEHLAKVRVVSPAIAETLELFNRKINLVLSIDERALSSDDTVVKSRREVNISACGIAFPVPEAIDVGKMLQLDMTLLPSYINLRLKAQVVDSVSKPDLSGDDSYLLRADFIALSEVDQELLVQHVIRCQAQALKERREARDR